MRATVFGHCLKETEVSSFGFTRAMFANRLDRGSRLAAAPNCQRFNALHLGKPGWALIVPGMKKLTPAPKSQPFSTNAGMVVPYLGVAWRFCEGF